jgi:hypothetical protein
MKNYELVNQWAATLNVNKAYREITALKKKYPWLKCEETLAFIMKMDEDLSKIQGIIKLQEKQNAIHREFVRVSRIADEAIANALIAQYNIKL